MSDERKSGTIKTLTEKGYGFIKRGNNEKDLFFHAKELLDAEFEDLQEGDTVTFVVGVGREDKPCAREVTREARRE